MSKYLRPGLLLLVFGLVSAVHAQTDQVFTTVVNPAVSATTIKLTIGSTAGGQTRSVTMTLAAGHQESGLLPKGVSSVRIDWGTATRGRRGARIPAPTQTISLATSAVQTPGTLLCSWQGGRWQVDPGPLQPLYEAAGNDDMPLLRYLLDHDANPNAADPQFNGTPLHWAATARGGENAIVALLAKGAAVDPRNNKQRTPLHLAAGSGNLAATALLLTAGAEVNAVDATGDTPLHYAAVGGYTGPVRVLLSCGADMNLKNAAGLTARDAALRKAQSQTATVLRLAAARAEDAAEIKPAAWQSSWAAFMQRLATVLASAKVPSTQDLTQARRDHLAHDINLGTLYTLDLLPATGTCQEVLNQEFGGKTVQWPVTVSQAVGPKTTGGSVVHLQPAGDLDAATAQALKQDVSRVMARPAKGNSSAAATLLALRKGQTVWLKGTLRLPCASVPDSGVAYGYDKLGDHSKHALDITLDNAEVVPTPAAAH